MDLLPPLLLAVAIDAIFLETRPFSLAGVPAAWIPASRSGQFWLAAGLIVGSYLLTAATTWLRARYLGAFAQYALHDVRTETYDRLQRLRLSFYDEKQTGS